MRLLRPPCLPNSPIEEARRAKFGEYNSSNQMADELATTKQSLILPRVSLWDIFITWFWMGLQSFGGGSSTFILIHRACISRGWQTEEEFVRTYALAQISPGINLLKLTILVTNKLRGLGGALAGLAGLMIPSGVVTVLMTAGFG